MSAFWPFVARRSFGALAAVIGVSLAVFALRHAVPGDPVDAMLGEQATETDREALRACLDLDKGMGGQLAAFGRDVLSGSLGISCRDRRSTVSSLIRAVYPRTLELALAAVGLALLVALPLGTLACWRSFTCGSGGCPARPILRRRPGRCCCRPSRWRAIWPRCWPE
jgi:peptide/nickel transport system permease protein